MFQLTVRPKPLPVTATELTEVGVLATYAGVTVFDMLLLPVLPVTVSVTVVVAVLEN